MKKEKDDYVAHVYIKTALEDACPGVVSCADILALAAAVSSVLAHGPYWKVPLGRRDGLTANRTLANINLPAPFFNLTQLKDSFAVQGLDTTDLVALSGLDTTDLAHDGGGGAALTNALSEGLRR
ncbi:hypothetical protein RJT34_17696 [Clitoria ternatea]|uniref:peroxidase n=1 Tax=Clitoria ternatea TaxID=43366 RepID=A0AAN9PDC9_CLITE